MSASPPPSPVAPLAGDGLSAWIAPTRTALVIIDMQVDFALPEGVLGQAGLDMSMVAPAIAQAERLADLARAAGAPVVFVGLQTRAESDSPAWRERFARRGDDADLQSAICRAGARGAEFVGPQPLAGELVVPKTRYSGFFGTALQAELASLGVDTLLVCGLTTECCVACTVQDAFHLDYQVFVVRDACAAYAVDIHEATLKAMDLNFAILVDTEAVAGAWSGTGRSGEA